MIYYSSSLKNGIGITGARWSLQGAEAILKLRSLNSSGDWEEYWSFHRSFREAKLRWVSDQQGFIVAKRPHPTPIELGLRVCVLQDQFGFTLNHHVMQKQTDNQVAVPMAEGTKNDFRN